MSDNALRAALIRIPEEETIMPIDPVCGMTVDPAKKQVTLEDGTTLTIPPTVKVEWGSVKPGAMVMVSYVEAGQQKTVKKFEVKS